MTKLWAITVSAFTETVRQPIFTILLLATFGVLILDVPLTGYSMADDAVEGDLRLLVDLGLSTLMFSGVFFAAFSASGALSREIERGTVLTVVTKPVPRPTILGGKFLGVAAAVTVAFYLTAIVFLMTVRLGVKSTAATQLDPVVLYLGIGALVTASVAALFCNYFFGWQFAGANVTASLIAFTLSAAALAFTDKNWTFTSFGAGVDMRILAVLLLLWIAVMVVTALAVAISTRLGQGATLGICLGVFMFSVATADLFGQHMGENLLARVAYWITPNLAYFFTEALMTDQPITGRYVALAAGYGACYAVAALLVGVVLFQNREIDRRTGASAAPGLVNAYAWVMRLTSLAVVLIGLTVLAGQMDRTRAIHAGIAVVAGAGGWVLAGLLGRGIRWARGVLQLLTAAELVTAVVVLGFLRPQMAGPEGRIAVLVASAAHALYVLALSLRGSARSHFAGSTAGPAAIR